MTAFAVIVLPFTQVCSHTAEESLAIIDAREPPNEPPESFDQWRLIENETAVPGSVKCRTLRRDQTVKVRVEYLMPNETPREWVWLTVDAVREFCRGKTYYTGHSIEYTLLFIEGESVLFDSSH